jgi:hypothetical protein
MTFEQLCDLESKGQLFIPMQHLLRDGFLAKIPSMLKYDICGSRKAIFLIGYPGSGKSTQGSILARTLNMEYVNIDDLLRSGIDIYMFPFPPKNANINISIYIRS